VKIKGFALLNFSDLFSGHFLNQFMFSRPIKRGLASALCEGGRNEEKSQNQKKPFHFSIL
jgi:hypothetical protein